jgi:hypothetical protein
MAAPPVAIQMENDMKTITSMTLSTLALAMALLAAPAAHAQEEGYFNFELGNGRWSAAEPPVSPAYSDRAYFNPEASTVGVPESELASAAPEHTEKIGNLKLAAATLYGDVVLQPGRYEVWKGNAGEQRFVEFSQTVENDYVPEGVSVYERQVIARIYSTPEALNLAFDSARQHSTLAMVGRRVARLF